MTFSEETMRMADQILEGADLGGDFIEHYGVKGQKRGVRRYQNEDGSLTDLGRRHYGIFERMRNYFSPASKGYRAAQKQKKIDEKIKYQQKVNELKRLKNESKEEEYRIKQMKRTDKEERKARKFEQDIREKELESKERQFNLQQKTMLDIQKQKDIAQSAREQAQREYQTQQEIAKGKTFLGRLQKGAKLVAAVSGMAGSGKKIAEAIGIDTSKFVTEWTAKFGDDSSSEKPKSEKPKTEKPKSDAPKPDTPPSTNQPENNRNRFRMDLSGWDPNKQYSWSIDNQGGNQNKPRLTFDTSGWDPNNKQTWSPSNETGQKKKISIDLSGWDPNKQYSWNTSFKEKTEKESPSHTFNTSFYEVINNKYKGVFDTATPKDKKTATEKNRYYSEEQRLKLQDAAEDDGAEGFKRVANRFVMSPEAKRKERQERKEAEAKAKQEALEKARDIKQRWDNFYKFQQESSPANIPKSDTGSFISSVSPSKIADMLLGKLPENQYEHINLGAAMRTNIGSPTDYREEFKKRKDWQRKQRFGHDDMQEDAGEIEDAE